MRIRSSSWQPMSACVQGLAAGYPVTFCDESSGGSSAISAQSTRRSRQSDADHVGRRAGRSGRTVIIPMIDPVSGWSRAGAWDAAQVAACGDIDCCRSRPLTVRIWVFCASARCRPDVPRMPLAGHRSSAGVAQQGRAADRGLHHSVRRWGVLSVQAQQAAGNGPVRDFRAGADRFSRQGHLLRSNALFSSR